MRTFIGGRVAPMVMASLMTLLVVGCIPAWTATAPGAPRVAAVGDSILRQLQFHGPDYPRLRTALTRSLQDQGWGASVRGENRYMIQWVRGFTKYAADHGAAGVILVVGSNDAAWIRGQANKTQARNWVKRQIRDTLNDVSSTDCVVWPTVPPRSVPGAITAVSGINSELRRQAALRPDLTVPEWGVEVTARPEYLMADGLHLSVEGEAAFQALLFDAMHACLGTNPPAPPTTTTTVPTTAVPLTTTSVAPTTTTTTVPVTTTVSVTTTAPPTTTTTAGPLP